MLLCRTCVCQEYTVHSNSHVDYAQALPLSSKQQLILRELDDELCQDDTERYVIASNRAANLTTVLLKGTIFCVHPVPWLKCIPNSGSDVNQFAIRLTHVHSSSALAASSPPSGAIAIGGKGK